MAIDQELTYKVEDLTKRVNWLERELSRKTQNLHDRIDGRGTRSYGNRPMPNCFEGRTADGTEAWLPNI